MPRANSPTDKPTTPDNITWDGSPLTRYAWQKDLPRRLTRANPSFRTLCEYGYVIDQRGKVVCATPNHRDNLYNNNVARRTFKQPCDVLTFVLINPAKPLTAIPDDSATRYVIAPEVLLSTDSRLFEEIAETISNPKRRDDYYDLSAGSGLRLLYILSQELQQQSPELGAWAASEIASLQLSGISSPTIAAFDEYRDRYEDLNGQLDAPATESSLAAHYFAQVRRLGDMLATKLKLRMTTDAASGDLAKTVAAITAVLNEEEATTGTGRALYGSRDPLKGRNAKGGAKGKSGKGEKRVWTKGKDETCSVCNGEEGGGEHLRKDCPRNPPQQSQSSRGGRGNARAASSYHFYDDHDAIVLHDGAADTLFSDGMPDVSEIAQAFQDEAEDDDVVHESSSPVVQTGSARMSLGRGRGTPPGSSTPPVTPDQPISHSRHGSQSSTRSSIERLNSNSPLADMRMAARELGSRIDLSVGGKNRRTKFEILQELRRSVGLPPVEPPTGIPIGPSLPTPTPPTTIDDTGAANDSAWPWKGGPPRSLVCLVADGEGGIVQQHTFATTWSTLRDAAPSSYTSPVDGPPIVSAPPAGSVWLGALEDGSMYLWGQRDGQLVRSAPRAPNAASGTDTNKSTPDPTSSQARPESSRPSPTAGLGASSIAALIVTLGSLLLSGRNPSDSKDDASMSFLPSNPGILFLPHWDLICPCFVCAWLLLYLTRLAFPQAKQLAQRGRRALLAYNSYKYKPPRALSSGPFDRATDEARLLLHKSLVTFSPPWLPLLYAVQLMILSYLSLASRTIGYRSRHGPQLADSLVVRVEEPWRPCNRMLSRFAQSASNVSPRLAFFPLVAATRWSRGDCASVLLYTTAACSVTFLVLRVISALFSQSALRNLVSLAICRLARPTARGRCAPTTSTTHAPVASTATSTPPTPPPGRVGKAALSSRNSSHHSHKGWRSRFEVSRWFSPIVDSGCTWHIHNVKSDLVHLRPCSDTVVDAHGRAATCEWMGDLPLCVRDNRGREFCLLLRGVRLAEQFSDTLISVDQLWATSGVDTVFRDVRQLVFTRNDDLRVPFRRVNGSYTWEVGLLASFPASSHSGRVAAALDNDRSYNYKGEVHSATSQSHVHALPANGVAALLHRRLHVGIEHIRRLARFSVDAPAHLASASRLSCDGCSEASATRLPHSGVRYQPSHVGRLVHADIVGPFVCSRIGSYKYGLVLVDDHSRYKAIKFLRSKSEAPVAVRSFVADLNAGVSTRSATPVRVVGTLHTDNAGEFLSREFKELLDAELISHTTCPPHVHQLNGVSERAIRSILQLARAYLVSSCVSVHHWPEAFDMAVDVLNRTSGPPSSAPGGGPSSYEVLTGVPPRIMHIMPFGCRAFAVKPRSQYSKTTLDPRAWVGINLGHCPSVPGAYRVYVPATGRVVVTSDVYFLESFFPLRPRGTQLDDSAPPMPVPAPSKAATAALSRAQSALTQAYSRAVDRSCSSSRVLLLFSGPQSRPDGLAAFLRARGIDVDQVDSDVSDGGGDNHDILNDAF